MEIFDTDPKTVKTRMEIYNDQAKIWFERAATAYQRNSIEVSKDALWRWWKYRQELSAFEGKPTPEQPKEPEHYFGRRDGHLNLHGSGPGFGRPGGDPNQPAPVPRRPHPDAGASEVEIPLPTPITE